MTSLGIAFRRCESAALQLHSQVQSIRHPVQYSHIAPQFLLKAGTPTSVVVLHQNSSHNEEHTAAESHNEGIAGHSAQNLQQQQCPKLPSRCQSTRAWPRSDAAATISSVVQTPQSGSSRCHTTTTNNSMAITSCCCWHWQQQAAAAAPAQRVLQQHDHNSRSSSGGSSTSLIAAAGRLHSCN